MNWPLEALVLFPQVLGLSLEKRTVPRCNVIKALMAKGDDEDGLLLQAVDGYKDVLLLLRHRITLLGV
uniref:Uncharacterized protein n=1 Tax=Brassica oleracea var. oleracea TaxID=109376 RepID=A0A0D3BVL3_BRAOL